MKSGRRLLALLVVCTVALAAVPGLVTADTRAGGSVVVGENETITEDLTVMGGTVLVHGTVQGDVTALGGTVVVRGTVTGDVTAVGGSVDLGPEGTIQGSLTAAGGTVSIAGRVDGDVTAGADTISLAATAVVGGDLRYDGTLVRASGATVGGEVVRDGTIGPVPSVPDWVGSLYGLLTTFVVGALLLALLPGFVDDVAVAAAASAGRSLLAGLGFLVLAPIALVLVALTVVGIPVTVLGFVAWGVALYLGYVLGNYALGRYVLDVRGVENRWLALAVGVLLVAVLDIVPVLGGLVQFAVLLLGVGALVRLLYRRFRRRRGRDPAATDAPGLSDARDAGASTDAPPPSETEVLVRSEAAPTCFSWPRICSSWWIERARTSRGRRRRPCAFAGRASRRERSERREMPANVRETSEGFQAVTTRCQCDVML